MNPSDYRICLDLQAPHGAVELSMKQGDTHRCIYITLTDGGRLYEPANCCPVFTAKKPDGTVIYNRCRVEEQTVIYEVTPQTTAAPGRVSCELRLYSPELETDSQGIPIPGTGKLITAAAFAVAVHPRVCQDGDVVASAPEATALEALVAEGIALVDTVQTKLDNGAFVGDKGDKGDKGDQGDKGEKGDKGDKGDPGWDTVEITVDESQAPLSVDFGMDYAGIHEILSNGGCLRGVLQLTDRFGYTHTYVTSDVRHDGFGYSFAFDGYGRVSIDSGDELSVDPAPVEMIGGVTYAHRLGVRGAQEKAGEDPDGVFAEYAGTRDDGVTDQVELYSTKNYGNPVGIRGVAAGEADTDAVNKKQLDDAQRRLIDKLCPSFTESGSVVTCEPVEGHPLQAVSQIAVTQTGEGTASPDNIRPFKQYSAVNLTRCGKNLVNPTAYMRDSNGGTTLNGDVFTSVTTSGSLYVNTNWGSRAVRHPAGTYTISIIPISDNVKLSLIVYSASSGAVIAQKACNTSRGYTLTFTADERFHFGVGGGSSDMWGTHSYKLQLEVGSAATEYEPYKGDTFTMELGETVYGGSLNWATGELAIEYRAIVFDGVTHTARMTATDANVTRYCYITVYPTADEYPLKGGKAYVNRASSATISGSDGSALVVFIPESVTGAVSGDDRTTVVTKFNAVLKQWYNEGEPLVVVYSRRKPITVQLTPQEISALAGVNTIYSDTGDTAVTGRADPRVVLDRLTNAVLSLGGNV